MIERIAKWFVDKNFISVRSGMLYVAVWMTFDAAHWAARYAELLAGKGSAMSGTDISLVVAAVTGPITLFTGFVYKFYSDSRS